MYTCQHITHTLTYTKYKHTTSTGEMGQAIAEMTRTSEKAIEIEK